MSKVIIAIIVTICLMTVSIKSSIVHANSTDTTVLDLNFAHRENVGEVIRDITYAVLNKDHSEIADYRQFFTSTAYSRIELAAMDNNLIPINEFSVTSLVIDYTTPYKSTTEDTVIFANIKCNIEGRIDAAGNEVEVYNKLILFEYHVNADGLIYGYNIWQY